MKVYICRHSDNERAGADYFVGKNYEYGISWLREKARGCSGNANQSITHFSISGSGVTQTINAMKLISESAGVPCDIDPLVNKIGACKILSESFRSVANGKVQNWRDREVVQK